MPIAALGPRRLRTLAVFGLLVAATAVFGAVRLLRWIDLARALPTAEEAQSIVLTAEALRWLGTPYAYGAEGPAAMDCSGFVHRVMEDAACLADRDPPRESREWSGYGMAVKGQILPGDILLFKRGGQVDHVAIALSSDSFIHAASRGPRRGVVISSFSEPYWHASFAEARRIGGE